jgi:hypothetical protein
MVCCVEEVRKDRERSASASRQRVYYRLNVFSCNRLSITRYGVAATVMYTAKMGRLTGRTPGLTPRSTCDSRSQPISQA